MYIRTDSLPQVDGAVSDDVADPADEDDVKARVSHQGFQQDSKGLDYRNRAGDNRRHEDTGAD